MKSPSVMPYNLSVDYIPSLREPPNLDKLASGNPYYGLDNKKELLVDKSSFFVVKMLRKRYFSGFVTRIRTRVKHNAFRPQGEKLHQHLFTITYYLPKNDKRL